ncbi:LysR substrate-binding domain-containing protein [Acetobacter farinalis]|uniref:LysR substrate-binding domain-containing protein n=1 Tax=Acetobacter farinalis TaxID=1260984 RepID=A0ABT3Q3J5_9PROT|nr:LysR family transcriptional regulator [Acetobacter farinalis]MCX2559854.1 LysR substrate-binding domain-containing protein [Acetobacter farinalis]NHO28515.1 LysR family transcriptional regulator [Acetobacter farinalis]
MTLEQLRIFLCVAEREHMTDAARILNITQSAASAAIAALEARHGIRLFHRVGRGIVLTEAGRLFLAEARAILDRVQTAESMLDDLSGLRRGSLRLVASQTIAAYWLPPLLAGFRERFPHIQVVLEIGNTAQVAAHVQAGRFDLGIVEGQVDNPVLAQWPIAQDQLILVRATPFDVESCTPEFLQNARWVMREQGSGTRSTLDVCLRQIGVHPESLNEALVLPSNESVRTAVEAGAGIAGLSSLVVAPALAAGTLHAAPISFGPRVFFGLRHKERYHSQAVEALTAFIA